MPNTNFRSQILVEDFINSLTIPCILLDAKRSLITSNKIFQKSEDKDEFVKIINDDLFRTSKYFDQTLKINKQWYTIIKQNITADASLSVVWFLKNPKANSQTLLIKNLNHDLNNLLTSILNSAMILRTSLSNSESEKLLSGIEVNTLRAASILESMLNDDDKISQSPTKINLAKLIPELINSLKYFSTKNITFNLINPYKDIYVIGNFDNIYRTLQNVCVNAIEAIKENGKIEIELSIIDRKAYSPNIGDDSNRVCISIRDNGIGIKKSDLKKIFDRNYSTKIKKNESGLGLNIAKEIIEKNGGYIEVDSKYLSGTEFRIFLPIYKTIKQANLNRRGVKNLLIADDEVNILQLLKELLTSYNYKVFTAKNGIEALKILDAEKNIDVIIIDNKMPKMSGIECIREFRKRDYSGKVIMTTGSPGVKFDDKIMSELDIYRLLLKPYDFNNLLEVIQGLTV